MSDYPEITLETVLAARAGDFAASAEIIAGTEGMVKKLTFDACRRATRLDLVEDMEQQARLVIWECVKRYEAQNDAKFTSFVYRRIIGAIDDEMSAVTRPGVSGEAMKMFVKCLQIAEGDAHAAEKLASVGNDRRRLSPELAHAARLAWQRTESLDTPVDGPDGDTITLGELQPDPYGYGVPEDLIEPRDIEAANRARNIKLAHALLDLVSEKKSFILKATYGIDPVPLFEDDNEIAEYMGCTRSTVGNHRHQALKALRSKGEALLNV